ncbi:serine/threonine protein kinase, partial [Striga asiatica]
SILSSHYSIPDYVRISKECKHLLSRIFVAALEKEANMQVQNAEDYCSQKARKPGDGPKLDANLFDGSMDLDEIDIDADIDDVETSGDFVSERLDEDPSPDYLNTIFVSNVCNLGYESPLQTFREVCRTIIDDKVSHSETMTSTYVHMQG